jgi:hypothetical protein
MGVTFHAIQLAAPDCVVVVVIRSTLILVKTADNCTVRSVLRLTTDVIALMQYHDVLGETTLA